MSTIMRRNLGILGGVLLLGIVACVAHRGSRLERTQPPTPVVRYPEERTKDEILQETRAADRRTTRPTREGAVVADLDINRHGDECIAAIGPIPAFNCLDGALIPITVNGVEPQPGQFTARMSCDRPVQLVLGSDGQCVPYARLGTLPAVRADGSPDSDVNWMFICRRYKLRQDPNYPNFEDVAIVGHRKSTGATCFLQTLSSMKGLPDGIPATRVPPPSERRAQTPSGAIAAEDFWLSPQDTAGIHCYSCHDSDPWIHTPYVDQVKGRSGAPEKPLVPDAPRIEDPMRYVFVGSQYFSDWPAASHFEPFNNRCVSCHRIGTLASSGAFTENAIGRRTPNTTAAFKQYPHSHWMPPDEPATMTEPTWNTFYRDSADQILSCRQNPSQSACRLRPTNP